MKPQRCKGMRDLLPAEMARFRRIEKVCRETLQQWGYQEVRTPTIEYLHLFTSAGTLTPQMLGKVYSFLDWDGWSGERVVLRPDGTIPVARLYAENMEKDGLARLFYAANIFMFEEAGERPRERWQCGAELIGSGEKTADAELVILSGEIVNKLGVKNVALKLSHAGMMQALLAGLESNSDEQHKLFDQVLAGDADTLDEIGRENPEFAKALRLLMDLKGKLASFVKEKRAALVKEIPGIAAPLDDFLAALALLDSLGVAYEIDIVSGAGFEYYTGMIFQLYAGGEKVGGGGRYDALIPAMGGGNVPACGFALYLDRCLQLVSPDVVKAPEVKKVLVRGEEKAAFVLAESLRRAGYVAVIDLGGKAVGDYGWVVDIKKGGVGFQVVNSKKSQKADAKTLAEVIKLLEGDGGG